MEKRDVAVVALSISNPFGGAYETRDIKGAAHVIEHMLFTGTKSRNHEDISGEIEKKGGILNAFTDHEVTSFWFKLPSKDVFVGLDILADMLNNPSFNAQKFEKEKKVVIEEIKLNHDDPKRSVHEQIEQNLFKPPFGDLIIGSENTVNSLNRDFIVEFFNKNYNPSNFIVTIVGSSDFNKICNYLENKFKKGNGTPKKIKIVTKNFSSHEERSGVDQANMILAMHAPLPKSKEFYSLHVLNSYLAEGMSSRLFLKIREEKGLAYTVHGNINAGKDYSFYSIYAGTTKKAISEVTNLILKEFENVKNMTEKELEESKQKLIGLKKISSEESINVMNELMYYELFTKAEDYYSFDDKINRVKLSDVKKIAKSIIKSYSLAIISPKE